MAKILKGEYRKSTGYLSQKLSARNIQGLMTDGQVDDELWTLLDYYSEVEDVGKKHLLDLGIPKTKLNKTFKHFRSYIRQAKNYYLSAKILHTRSAGLLYYYCFLNLAKAFILQSDPSIGGTKIGHGMSTLLKDFTKKGKQIVKVYKGNDVFQRFYNLYFGTPILGVSLNIKDLFRYCTDISYQCVVAGIGDRKIEPCLYIHLIDKDTKTGWPVLGIANFLTFSKYKKSISQLMIDFEQIELPEFASREYFKESRYELSNYTFFQSKKTFGWVGDFMPTLESRDLVLKCLKNVFQTNYFDNGWSFLLSLPYKVNQQIQMDETIAIYIIMFYLSNLVRYNPTYLEEMLSRKEFWLIDSFVKYCSVTFLRSITSRIIGTDYVIGKR